VAEARQQADAERPLAAELALTVACCHWPPSSEGDERIRMAAASVRNWERFDGIVRRNRIYPLVQRALTRAGVGLPDALARNFAIRSHAAARRSLVLARESVRLQRAFDGEGIVSMIVKGTPLAMLAYGEIGLKEAADIDLLVSAEDVLKARHLLLQLGGRMDPLLTEGEFARFVEHDKEAVFVFDDLRVTVELHWRLVTHRTLLRGVDAHGPEQFVNFPGGTLRTLADEPLFAFLCLHGGFHNWSRLKWLVDVSAFLAGRPAEQVEHLHRTAQTLGAGRSAVVAMLLCRRLFGLRLAPELLASLLQDPIARALAANVVAGLSYRDGVAEQESYSVPWLRMRVAQFFLAPGASHLMDHARVTWVSAMDRARISLPRRLDFMYHVLRIPLWLGRTSQVVWSRIR
jgi:hypothetical protein